LTFLRISGISSKEILPFVCRFRDIPVRREKFLPIFPEEVNECPAFGQSAGEKNGPSPRRVIKKQTKG